MMTLKEMSDVVSGELIGADAKFKAVKIDSREIEPGDLFVAIPGENFDGHDFVGKALENGANGALVSRHDESPKFGQVVVGDTTKALGILAKKWRSGFDIPVIAVTGSNGKTTVTALIASILDHSGCCLSPKGSFNNHWGVPLTLLRLTSREQYAVIEMGMNNPGEIDYLSNLTRPSVALLNNVGSAHLEGLGSVENIAKAKFEIFHGLAEQGIAVLNADDRFFDMWKQQLGNRPLVTFGTAQHADVRLVAVDVAHSGSVIELALAGKVVSVDLPLMGRHNAMNAAAAAAACFAIGIPNGQIKSGLENSGSVAGRLRPLNGINGATIIDDSYNANPTSIRAAIDVLAQSDQRGILVLGPMAELGDKSETSHREVGEYAKQSAVDGLYCLCEAEDSPGLEYKHGYGATTKCFTALDELLAALSNDLTENDIVIVKGSRSARMERVVVELTDAFQNPKVASC